VITANLVKIFLEGSQHTIPELAKRLQVPPSTLADQLRKLVDLNIVMVIEPRSAGVRVYGKRYALNPVYKPKTFPLILLAASIAFTPLGLVMALIADAISPSFLVLLFSSIAGLLSAITLYRKVQADALNMILAKISEKPK
jgi:DNA-binding Lrp family transcriptional regulator